MSALASSLNQTIVKLTPGTDELKIEWEDGYRSQFHYVWLRDNCPQTPRVNCQRTIDPLTLPANPYPEKVSLNQEQNIEIVWANEDHISQFDPFWLRQNCYSNDSHSIAWQPKLWGSEKATSITTANYTDVFQNKALLKDWLESVRDQGIAILQNVPTEPGQIVEVASQLGCVRQTYWGKCNDVKSVANPKTDAWTNLGIVPHTDLSTFASPPAYLLFHYLKTSDQGGENALIDGFKIAEVLRQQAPEKFKLLSTLPVQFRFQHTDADLIGEGEIIHLNCDGEVKSIRCSPRAIQPFKFPPEFIKPYYDAYRTFVEMCNSDEYRVLIKFNPGDLLILDNHRVLHGRTKYVGERFIQTVYIERTELLSQLSVISR
ncbi:MAG: TauD/TfdA family dioxygenase [Microcoleaceae cyanobacterium]